MPKPRRKCIICSMLSWRRAKDRPDCYVPDRCKRVRAYWRNVDHYRKSQRERHRYIKYCGDKCAICGGIDHLEVHHVVPQAFGGKDTQMNTITLCQACHKVVTAYITIASYKRKGYVNHDKSEGQGDG